MVKFSIITPVWNKKEYTANFLNSLLSLFSYIKGGEIIIVDNNSTDGTDKLVEFYQKNTPGIIYIKLDENRGFSTGNDEGEKLAGGEHLLFVSNDVIINGDFITPICKELEAGNKLVGARLLDFDTGWNNFKETGVIPYLEGFCVGITKKDYRKIGGWDRDIFLDYEDLELSYRGVQNGLELKSLNLPVRHQIGGSSGGVDRLKITYESQRKMMDRHKLTKNV